MEIYIIYGLIFLTGLILGSFYNVVSLRTLSGEKLAFPPSHCVNCNHKLGIVDLFPVMSYLFLGGKCRYCKTKISAVYPIGELLTATSYFLIIYKFGFTFESLIQITFITIMIMATITDIKETLVPNRFVITGLILIFILRLIYSVDMLYYLSSLVMSFAILFMIMMLSRKKIINDNGEVEIIYGMGGADVKLYALIGLSIGIINAMASLFFAAIIGLLIQVPIIIKNKGVDRNKEIPFVPSITLGVLCTYFITFFNFI
ncbi:MAG TPA: prepilin peptidase [Clostridiales bacterium]|nr:prepilin peptidase [Clostridiales bacterium]